MLAELRKYCGNFALATQSLAYMGHFERKPRATVLANVDHVYTFAMAAENARLATDQRDWGEARKLGEKSRHMLETLQHIRAPEVRAWVESLHKPFWQTFRNRRKPKEP